MSIIVQELNSNNMESMCFIKKITWCYFQMYEEVWYYFKM